MIDDHDTVAAQTTLEAMLLDGLASREMPWRMSDITDLRYTQPVLSSLVEGHEEIIMQDQPNKPAGAFDDDGAPRDVEDQQAVKNQSTVTPEDYPEPAKGDPTPK